MYCCVKTTTHTLNPVQNEHGDIGPNIGPIILRARRAAGTDEERAGFPRFLVKVDECHYTTNSSYALEKYLSSFRIGTKCQVFRNVGHGATIDFEYEK